jgi:hypothetical protein
MAFRFDHPIWRKARIPLAIVAALLLVYGALYFILSRGKELDARHRSFTFTETFDFASGTFADYLSWSERRVLAARGAETDPAVVAGLMPFRMEPGPNAKDPSLDCSAYQTAKGYRAGVVITHDVLDSAYTQRALGEYFRSRCLLVFGLLLPGHGSRPGELLQTNWEDWAAAERFAVRELAKEVDYIYLAGHGVGGTLSILQASQDADISGLVLFAPQLDTPLVTGSWVASTFGWMIPPARWAEVVPAYTPYRYESRPWRLGGEVAGLVDATLTALAQRSVEVPVFTVVNQDDATVSTPAIMAYMAERVHPMSATLLYSGETLPDSTQGEQVVQAWYPQRGLRGLSHAGLMMPMEDLEFGWFGRSADCGHYFHSDRDAYSRCMQGERTVLGEITPANLEAGLLERTEFNPFFYNMVLEIDKLIAPVAKLPGYSNIQR